MNKRDFVLRGCSGLAAGVSLGAQAKTTSLPSPATAAVAGPRQARLQRFPDLVAKSGAQAWSRYAGQAFIAALPQGLQALELRAVETQAMAGPYEQFSLTFAVDQARTMDDEVAAGTVALSHPSSGQRLALYLQPAGADAQGTTLMRAEFSCLPTSA